jgi:DNA end-binding protein Ku
VEDLDLPDEEFEFKPAEKKMAQQLVSAMKGEFEADSYKDEYREALMAVLEAKVSGQPAEQRETKTDEPTKITDLMKVLEASVAAARKSRTAEEEPAPAKAAGRQKKPTALPAGRKASRTKEAVAASAAASAKSEPKRQERRRKTA